MPRLPRLKQASPRDHVLAKMRAKYACSLAIAWVQEQPSTATLQSLWDTCPRGGWLIWWWAMCYRTDRRRTPHLTVRAYNSSHSADVIRAEWATALDAHGKD